MTVSVSLILTSCKQKVICSWYYEKINAEVLLGKEKEKEIIVGVIDSGINENFFSFLTRKQLLEGLTSSITTINHILFTIFMAVIFLF